jgi:hypothetical protein
MRLISNETFRCVQSDMPQYQVDRVRMCIQREKTRNITRENVATQLRLDADIYT